MNQAVTPDDVAAQAETLIDEIIRMSEYSFERMPMLELIGERVASLLSESIAGISGSTCEASFLKLDYIAMWQALEAVPEPGFFMVCDDNLLEGTFLMAMDVPLVLTTMELMLGGNASAVDPNNTAPPTAIERRFSTRIAEVALSELRAGFRIAVEVDFELAGEAINNEAVAVTQPASLCVRLQFSLVQAGQVGNLQVIIPYTMLDPVRPKLRQVHFGERTDEANNVWQHSLSEQIERANVEVEAEFTRVCLSLNDILEWKTGDIFNLWVDENHEAKIIFNGKQSFNASLGKRQSGNSAVKITQVLKTEQEQNDDQDTH
jgi:flagellar motor switch protein FliM